ncbi:hypothetical protein TRIUR3_30269 [Triticum urartu]|uniref:Uncharacterized protein n=1 Tax=Triticum urartu TaxID=4572 RepID=M8A071_TRIUA|nr:hypothetical protein TRIUR3_30269 [Triticum urartu]
MAFLSFLVATTPLATSSGRSRQAVAQRVTGDAGEAAGIGMFRQRHMVSCGEKRVRAGGPSAVPSGDG